MAFIYLEIKNFMEKKQVLPNFASSFFFYLLPSFINERSHDTLSVFKGGALEHILRAEGWL